jgi:hypothetical protein
MEVFTLTSVTLTFPEALSTASYEDLKDYFDFFFGRQSAELALATS